MTEKDDPGEICARCGEGRHLHFGEHCLSSRDVNYNPHCTFAVSVAPAGASEPPSAFTLGQEFVSRVTSSNAPEGPSVIGPIERDEELVTFALELAVATLGAEGCACQPEEPCALCMCKEAVAHLRDTSPAPVSPVEPTPDTEKVRAFTVHICDDCLHLRGEMCHEPECLFCHRTMAEVAEYLDVLLIRPIIDGVGFILDEGTPLVTPEQTPRSTR